MEILPKTIETNYLPVVPENIMDFTKPYVYGKKAENIQGARNFQAVVDAAGTGDYATIAAAITAGATKLFVRTGTYNITADISLPNGAEIIGEDAKTTILDFGSAAYQMKADSSSGSEFTHIRIANLQFNNSSGAALLFDYTDKSIIENCIFEDGCNSAITFTNSDYNIITNCYFEATISIAGLHNRITQNRFVLTAGTAIGGAGNPIFVENNVISGPDVGISINGKAIVANNYITGAVNDGIIVATGPATVTGNHINSPGQYGIYLTSANNTVVGNKIFESIGISIYIYGFINANVVSGNNVTTGANVSGIKLLGVVSNGNYNMIIGNYVATSGVANGIFLDAMDSCIIANNCAITGTGASIRINDSLCNNNIVVGNQAPQGITDNGTGTQISNNI